MVDAKAVKIRAPGGAEVLEFGTLEVPEPQPSEILVEVAAAGLNRADVLQRRGFYPAPPGVPADVPGLEYAGTVIRIGEAVSSFRVGDPVMGIIAGGAMASHLVTHEREALPVPKGMSTVMAAAVPEVFFTAYDALFRQAGLGVGQVVLVHAVASGVGTAALQLGRVAGATVVGTSRSQEKLERCRAHGLEHPVYVPDGSFLAPYRAVMGDRGPDVVLDTVGASYLTDNVGVLASGGRIVIVGLLGGIKGELPLGILLAKRGSIAGSVLRSRPLEEKIALTQAFLRDVVPLFERGMLEPVIDDVMPMAEVAAAHRRMEDNATFGKIVLQW